MPIITNIQGSEILDSRGHPTIEVEIKLDNKISALASVPSGASRGNYEAAEKRDEDGSRFNGQGVLKAVHSINTVIKAALIGHKITDQKGIDKTLIELDGTESKANLGSNATLAVSIGACRAASIAEKTPLYKYLRQAFHSDQKEYFLPIPHINILNGGKHANHSTDLQEFMIIPHGFGTFHESVRAGSEIFYALAKLLNPKDYGNLVGDEGGHSVRNVSDTQALELLLKAIEKAGYEPEEQVSLGIDSAANEFFNNGKYYLKMDEKELTNASLGDIYLDWIKKYPIISLEDPFSENDWSAFTELTTKVSGRVQIVGDDLFATNPKRLREGIERQSANAVLVKPNQIGTVSETIETIKIAQENDYGVIVSHRSGETEDTFIVDLAMAVNAGQIKCGSVSRGERIAKYNQLMRIERALGSKGSFAKLPHRQNLDPSNLPS